MNTWGFLVIVLLLAAIPLTITLAGRADKKLGTDSVGEPVDKRFDERQLAARGKAHEYAFSALICYLMADYLLCNYRGSSWAQPGVDAFIGVCFGLAVFSVACICRDAYFKVGENVRRHLWWMWISTGVMAAAFVLTLVLHTDQYVVDGLVTFDAIFPAMMVYYIVVNVVITWRYFAAKREEREDDEDDGDAA